MIDASVISKNSSSYIIDDLLEFEELSEKEQQSVSGGFIGYALGAIAFVGAVGYAFYQATQNVGSQAGAATAARTGAASSPSGAASSPSGAASVTRPQ